MFFSFVVGPFFVVFDFNLVVVDLDFGVVDVKNCFFVVV